MLLELELADELLLLFADNEPLRSEPSAEPVALLVVPPAAESLSLPPLLAEPPEPEALPVPVGAADPPPRRPPAP